MKIKNSEFEGLRKPEMNTPARSLTPKLIDYSLWLKADGYLRVKPFKYIGFFFAVFYFSSTALYGARRMGLIDINIASARKFTGIPGINLELAESIAKYRQEKGYFESLKDLIMVPGIDEKLFKEVEMYLTLTPPREIEADRLYEEFDDLQEKESVEFVDVDIEKLDRYRANPLDINTATQSQLIELPYLTEEIAKDIIKYRRKQKGFTSVEELGKIAPDRVVKKFLPFIAALREEEIENFHFDMRFRYGVWPYPFSEDYFEADSIYHNPQYFYSRFRMYYGNKAELGMVLRKDRNSRELNYENIRNFFFIKQYLLLRNILTLDTVVVGNYSLDFGQGLFIQPRPFLVRRIPRKPRGLKEDKGTHFNDKFYGAAGVKRFGSWEVFGFYSDKPLIVSRLNDDGTVGTPPTEFYEYFQTYLDFGRKEHYDNFGSLHEKLYGGRVKYNLTATLSIGGGYYQQKFDPYIDPARDGGKDGTIYLLSDYYFRGDRVNLMGLDMEYTYRNLRLFLDFGRSRYHTFDRTVRNNDEYLNKTKEWYWDSGDAYQVLATLNYDKLMFWINYHRIDYDYFAFHSSPWITSLGADAFVRDEEGYIVGGKYSHGKFKTQLSFKYGRPIVTPRFYSSQINGLASWAAKDEYEVYWDNSVKVLRKFTVKFRNTYKIKNRTKASGEPSYLSGIFQGADFDLYIPYRSIKNRLEFIHEPTNSVRLKIRYETVDNAYPEIKANMYGYMTFGELRYKPSAGLTVYSRVTYWDAPKGVSAGAMEYTWPNALIPFGYYSTYGASDEGFRWYIMPTMKFSRQSKLWLKYEFWPRDDKAAKNVFKLQYEFTW